MESARRWFSKFRSKYIHKSSKKETATNGKEGSKALTTEEALSTATKQKVAAAKQYIEKHYKEQMKNLQERKERYDFCTSSHNEQSNYLTCHAYITYITNSYCRSPAKQSVCNLPCMRTDLCYQMVGFLFQAIALSKSLGGLQAVWKPSARVPTHYSSFLKKCRWTWMPLILVLLDARLSALRGAHYASMWVWRNHSDEACTSRASCVLCDSQICLSQNSYLLSVIDLLVVAAARCHRCCRLKCVPRFDKARASPRAYAPEALQTFASQYASCL
ncbi:AGC (cAMP-dependent, cGMP-dependent and protein kinase C) kinase family protein [Actinidia rufa]|uniref:AGC (cAMP-dependent, cGMP-dependent and protein kinase C) kinase family protein n=1 Tax=Actinidia rufa TaxID=165716 RepID=A0A7J0GTW6_9ERIC|nr:AGC (cAMP-dependent, cGMP-dependent and protein kinase C) kinase family protein [Actinidia rufa]